jgi:hypothetical protein
MHRDVPVSRRILPQLTALGARHKPSSCLINLFSLLMLLRIEIEGNPTGTEFVEQFGFLIGSWRLLEYLRNQSPRLDGNILSHPNNLCLGDSRIDDMRFGTARVGKRGSA